MKSQKKPLIILLTAALGIAAQAANAESVLRRGNGSEPHTIDPQTAQGVPESNILRDLFLKASSAKTRAATSSPASPKNGKSPQTAKLTPSTCATPNGATAARSPRTTSSMAGSARLIPRPVANTASSSTRSKTRKKSPKATKKTSANWA